MCRRDPWESREDTAQDKPWLHPSCTSFIEPVCVCVCFIHASTQSCKNIIHHPVKTQSCNTTRRQNMHARRATPWIPQCYGGEAAAETSVAAIILEAIAPAATAGPEVMCLAARSSTDAKLNSVHASDGARADSGVANLAPGLRALPGPRHSARSA